MSEIKNTGTLASFDKKIQDFLRDGYSVTSLWKDSTGIVVKLSHKNGKMIVGKYDYSSGEYLIK